MTTVHPTAVVSAQASLDTQVAVGPYAVIGPGVRIGRGTHVGSFCVLENDTTVGEDCQIFTGAVIGSVPQDLKYKGAKSSVVIGNGNIIREYVTVNLSTEEGARTVVGDNNLIMAYSHIAHDCRVGNHCIIANSGTLAGHVTIEDRAVVGGLVAIHQFVRVGTLAMIGGCSKVVTDIPPYATCDGHPARFYGLNLVGLKRTGMTPQAIRGLKEAYKIYYHGGLSKGHAIEEIKKKIAPCLEVDYLVGFLSSSERGICH
jgi:UDP-N-acetylglucosamine acyltransferase